MDILKDDPETVMAILETQLCLGLDELKQFSSYHLQRIFMAYCDYDAALSDPDGEFNWARYSLRREILSARRAAHSLLH